MRPLLFALLLPTVTLAAPVPKAKDEGKLYVTTDSQIVRMNPDGSEQEKLFDDKYTRDDYCASPDGTRVVSQEWQDNIALAREQVLEMVHHRLGPFAEDWTQMPRLASAGPVPPGR